MDYFIYLSNISFSSILEGSQFETTKLAHDLNTNNIQLLTNEALDMM